MWVLYWTITTMTTIGYGDFSPQTGIEAMLTIAVQVLAQCCPLPPAPLRPPR